MIQREHLEIMQNDVWNQPFIMMFQVHFVVFMLEQYIIILTNMLIADNNFENDFFLKHCMLHNCAYIFIHLHITFSVAFQ